MSPNPKLDFIPLVKFGEADELGNIFSPDSMQVRRVVPLLFENDPRLPVGEVELWLREDGLYGRVDLLPSCQGVFPPECWGFSVGGSILKMQQDEDQTIIKVVRVHAIGLHNLSEEKEYCWDHGD